jgi:hypothetical protein
MFNLNHLSKKIEIRSMVPTYRAETFIHANYRRFPGKHNKLSGFCDNLYVAGRGSVSDAA